MMSVKIKGIISALAGLFGSITAIYYGYVNFTLIAGLTIFLFTLMVQYSSIKIKITTTLAGILGLAYFVFSHHGGT